MRIVGPVARVVMLLLSLGVLALGLADVHDASTHPTEYLQVYGGTISEYLAGSYRQIAFSCVGIVLPIVAYADPSRRKRWDVAITILLGAFLISAIIGYVEWAKSGFDHPTRAMLSQTPRALTPPLNLTRPAAFRGMVQLARFGTLPGEGRAG